MYNLYYNIIYQPKNANLLLENTNMKKNLRGVWEMGRKIPREKNKNHVKIHKGPTL